MVHLSCRDKRFADIEAVIFDKDGTLADVRKYLMQLGLERSHRLNEQCVGAGDRLQKAFGMDGNNLDPFGLLAVGTRQENAIAAATYLAEAGCNWQQAMLQVQEMFRCADRALPAKAPHTPPFRGIPELLENLSKAGLKLAVLSSDSLENITKFLEYHHLQHFFQGWMGAEPGKPTKPDPILVHYLCDQLGVSPAATIMVGDAPGDIQMAVAAEMAGSIGVTWGWGDRPLQAAQPMSKISARTATLPLTSSTILEEQMQALIGGTHEKRETDFFISTLAHSPLEIRVSP